jgi:hypothetical protein
MLEIQLALQVLRRAYEQHEQERIPFLDALMRKWARIMYGEYDH